jgi:hypothetical protein
VANDAGGAEILSAYVKKHEAKYLFCLEGPAARIFQRKLGNFRNLSLSEAVSQSEALLCGSGWQSNLELQAIELAGTLGKPSICWLDHWVNYRARFERNGNSIFPSEVWVSDRYAVEIAGREIPEVPVHIKNNPYLEEVAEEYADVRPSMPTVIGKLAILYVCEPIGDHALLRYGNRYHWGYTEVEAIQYFFDNLHVFGGQIGQVLIRPHPSENRQKYESLVPLCNFPVTISEAPSLLADLKSSDYVVGSNSMAMVVAHLVGKRIISCIPPGGAPCSLPHSEIRDFGEIIRSGSLRRAVS